MDGYISVIHGIKNCRAGAKRVEGGGGGGKVKYGQKVKVMMLIYSCNLYIIKTYIAKY